MDNTTKLPSGWQWVKLEDLFDITSSKRVFESEWTKTGIPFYRAREIVKLSNHGFVNNELFISEEMFDEYAHKYGIPKEGDIMVTGVGTLGICYVVRPSDKFYFKDGNIIWFKRKDDVNVDSYFVEHSFQTDFVRNQIDNTAGSTVGTYTIIRAKNTIIPLPPLPEQQRLAKLLTEKLALVEHAKQKIEAQLEAAEQLTAAYLREVFESDEAKGWELVKLGDVVKQDKNIVNPSSNLPYLGLEHIESNSGKILKNWCEEDEGISSTFEFNQNHILYGKLRPYLNKVALPDFQGRCTTELIPFLPLVGNNRDFVAWLLKRDETVNFVMKETTGSRMPRADIDKLLTLKVPLPPIEKQKELATYLSEKIAIVEQLKTTLLAQLESVNQIPSALLKQAFNGEL